MDVDSGNSASAQSSRVRVFDPANKLFWAWKPLPGTVRVSNLLQLSVLNLVLLLVSLVLPLLLRVLSQSAFLLLLLLLLHSASKFCCYWQLCSLLVTLARGSITNMIAIVATSALQ
jgi:hypothetical protein